MVKSLGGMAGRTSSGLITLLLALTATTTLLADATDFTWAPTPVNVGQGTTCTAVNDGSKMISSCKWEYQYDAGILCTSGWYTGMSNDTSQIWFESTPGTFNVRLTVTYMPDGYPPVSPPQTIITKIVTVVAADGFLVTKGYNTPTSNGNGVADPPKLEVNFKITCGGNDAGPMIAGFPQEFLRNKRLMYSGRTFIGAVDTDWTPTTAGEGQNLFYKQGNIIFRHESEPPSRYLRSDQRR